MFDDWRFFFYFINILFRLDLQDALVVSLDLFSILIFSIFYPPQNLKDGLSFGKFLFDDEFIDFRFVSVFDHVFSSGVVEQGDDACPVGATLFEVFQEDFIFFLGPVSFFDLVVEMVLIAFSALFGCFEVFSSGVEVEVLGDLIPLSFFEFAG